MRVLLLETEAGVADDAVERLEQRGHEVLRCHQQFERRAFPCVGLSDLAQCPLEGGGVDVALTVRHRVLSRPAELEDGLACALRAHVPVVVSGAVDGNPFVQHGAVTVADGDVVAACEETAVAPLARHGLVALDTLKASLARHGLSDAGTDATVCRSRNGLRVTLDVQSATPDDAVALATTRVMGALRALDRHARSIDVAVERRG